MATSQVHLASKSNPNRPKSKIVALFESQFSHGSEHNRSKCHNLQKPYENIEYEEPQKQRKSVEIEAQDSE